MSQGAQREPGCCGSPRPTGDSTIELTAGLRVAVIVVAPDGRISLANASAAELFGYDPGELVGLGVDHLVPTRLRPRHASLRDAFAAAPENRAMGRGRDLVAVRKDGTEFPAEVALGHHVTDRGVFVTAVVIDITERVQAAEELRASEERNRVLVEYATEAITVLDAATGRWVDANPRAVELFGLPREELLCVEPWTMSPAVFPDGRCAREAAAALVDRAVAGEMLTFDWTHLDAQGNEIPCEIRMVRLPSTDRRLLRVAITDISERLRYQRELERSRDLLERAQRLANLGTWVRRQGQPTELSPGLQRVFGRDVSVLDRLEDGLPWIVEDDRAQVVEAFERAAAAARPVEFEYRIERPDGTTRWVRTVIEYMPEAGGSTVIGVVQDVDDSRRAEEERRQMQKMEAVGQLAGGIAHDFNNMLTGILGFADLALAQDLPEKARAHVGQIVSAAQRAAHLTSQLLAFGRRQRLTPRATDLNAEVAMMLPLLDRLIPESIEVVPELEEGLPAIFADPSQMHQVVLNLTINARDAMPDGGAITIGTRCADGPAGPRSRVLLSVADEGTGMDEATMARIFEPFFTTKAVGEGTGMGLATVNGIIEQTGGRIHVDSNLGRGTTFVLEFPSLEPPPAETQAGAESWMPAATGRPRRIVVCDDDDMVRTLVVDILELDGYAVVAASSGREVLEQAVADGTEIDLLVTDLVMPGMNGRELARRLRETRPALPVLFSSGYDHANVGLGHGKPHDYHLPKPYAPGELLRAVEAALAERPSSEESRRQSTR